MLGWRSQPNIFRLHLNSANPSEPDENFSLSISTDRDDVFSLMLTARSEPFEGINETINVQYGSTICKIDDFRRISLWRGDTAKRRRFWPKDAGHSRAVMQPFGEHEPRRWEEVVRSTILMLHVTDMVRDARTVTTIDMNEELKRVARKSQP
jgi:hypothetical protein